MRLFTCVAAAILAVGFTHALANTPTAYYFDATFFRQEDLMDYGAYAIATVRNLTTPTPSSDPYHRNYTTLTKLINSVKPNYDENVQHGLEQILQDVFATQNMTLIVEFTALLYDSLERTDYVKRDYQIFLNVLDELSVSSQSGIKPGFNVPFQILFNFYKVNDDAFTRWANALEVLGTTTSVGLDRFRKREKDIKKVYKKYRGIAFGENPENK